MTISKHTHARCEETIARLEAKNASLRQRLDEMERRLALNSQNSGKPPSSDGLKKPPSEARTRSLRRKSGRNAGGQTGHPGRTLHQRSDPDATWVHAPSVNGTERCPVFRQDKMSHFLHVKRLQPGWLPRSSLAVLLLHWGTEHPRLAPGLEPVALALDVDRCRVV